MARRARRTWILVVIGLVGLVLIGGWVALRSSNVTTWAIRTSALLGYLCVFTAALSALFMRELVRFFGRPFVKTHHVVTVSGLVLLALHGLIVVLNFGPSVLIPNTLSWRLFLMWGGPPAFYLIAIASLAALWRTSGLRKQWRYVHWLNYLAFFLATAHAILLGSEFQSAAMKVIPILLAVALAVAFVLKRTQRSRTQRSRARAKAK